MRELTDEVRDAVQDVVADLQGERAYVKSHHVIGHLDLEDTVGQRGQVGLALKELSEQTDQVEVWQKSGSGYTFRLTGGED